MDLDLMSLGHINAVVESYEGIVDCFANLLGGQLLLEIPPDGDLRACLMSFGPVIFEFFAPGERLRGYGKQLEQYGPCYHGLEYRVGDVLKARNLLLERGIRLLIDVNPELGRDQAFIMTRPRDTQGVSVELFEGDWLASPPPSPYLEPMHPPAYWEATHPLHLQGLDSLAFVGTDLAEALQLWTELLGCEPGEKTQLPELAAEGSRLTAAGTSIDLLAPTGPGPIADHLEHYGPRLRSVTYRVRELSAVRDYFGSRHVGLAPGERPGSLLADPAALQGLRLQFCER